MRVYIIKKNCIKKELIFMKKLNLFNENSNNSAKCVLSYHKFFYFSGFFFEYFFVLRKKMLFYFTDLAFFTIDWTFIYKSW